MLIESLALNEVDKAHSSQQTVINTVAQGLVEWSKGTLTGCSTGNSHYFCIRTHGGMFHKSYQLPEDMDVIILIHPLYFPDLLADYYSSKTLKRLCPESV
ncbi:hypothetical protein M513_06422 [Trichuris suis]|uniref:Uncharacterized protein n=1 Tax=Trichuris suis TaxID=68888 RepID=A0A085M6C0_9BILA|nr:hypothetical protein M513_06422 [Trichuris suis]